jgi:Skp family chaperone for outer membrane proteins
MHWFNKSESKRRIYTMKQVLFVVMCFTVMATLIGCEKVDQAFETIDKVKSYKTDLEKKGNEVKEKAQSLIPEPARGLLGTEKKESEGKTDKGKDD